MHFFIDDFTLFDFFILGFCHILNLQGCKDEEIKNLIYIKWFREAIQIEN